MNTPSGGPYQVNGGEVYSLTGEQSADQALARVGLASKGHRLPNQISGGEQERVAIARAVVNRPPILLADEPTGNLDTRTGREIMQLLQELNGEGMTIIMVTHSPEWVRYTHRVLHISDGRLKGEEIPLATPYQTTVEFVMPHVI